MFARGYVTITQLMTFDDPASLKAWVDALEEGLAQYATGEPRAVPDEAQALVGFDLTSQLALQIGG